MPHEAPVMPLEYISPPCVEVRPPHQAPARIVVVAGAEREELREGLREIPRRVLGLVSHGETPTIQAYKAQKQQNSQTNVKDPGLPLKLKAVHPDRKILKNAHRKTTGMRKGRSQ